MARDVEDSIKIPVIDISTSNPDAAHELVEAAASYGFIFVKNNGAGVPSRDVEHMFEISKALFDLPAEVKETCSINSAKAGANKGWLSMHTETLDPTKQKRGDFKEAFNIGEFHNKVAQQPFPAPITKDQKTIGEFMDSCHELCLRIHELLALGLRIPDEAGGRLWFSKRHDRGEVPTSSVLRLLYYPALTASPEGKSDIRAGAHSDYGSITLLFRLPGQPGLEILTPSGDSWAPVPVNPNDDEDQPILVNIGDLLSYWTGGYLRSTVHRVIFPKAVDGEGMNDRYSIAYFCHPREDTKLVEVPSPVIQDHKKKHVGKDVQIGMGVGKLEEASVLTAKGHLERRLAATYGAKQQGSV